jgi:Pyruvate/2-oxoacid:ferredoxin oxidoreductase delta subunit
MKVLRKIIEIDEDKCNGCGECIITCAEGSLEIVDGKARVIADKYCDGLGACLGECPMDALTIVEREADEFDVEAVEEHLATREEPLTIGESVQSALSQWPIQIRLIPPNAPILKEADLLVVADCVPASFPGFHAEFLKNKVLMLGCPKLDDAQEYVDKFTEIFSHSEIKSITTTVMEVPCCSGLPMILKKAMEASGKEIPTEKVVISTKGQILDRITL